MKLLNLFIALATVTASCTASPQPAKQDQPQQNKPDQSEGPKTPAATGKTLVAYYSFTGNCRAIVTALTSSIEADVLEILPAEEGLDYAANNYEIGSSLIAAIRNNPSDPASYPAIKTVDKDASNYDTIIIVTPLWWSNMAAPMQTYLFQNGSKMAGKTIGLIVSSASSGISSVVADAKRLIPSGNFLQNSLWIRASEVNQARELTASWCSKLFPSNQEDTTMKVTITAAGKAFTATIEDSETGKAFIQRLPMTLEMSELNGNEKYCYGVALPHNDSRYDRIEAGDIMLYSGDCVVLFYGPAGGYSYTRIGKIEDITGLADALGRGSVSVKFEKQ